ncbi:L-ascorbate oxidase-like protein [Medicago truncatula]|uniref:L-ascorbate oxidase-like protein n=1 Tax=Medicago truncatula TaxID=3880 RepID=G7JLM1_MEDTR|nr:L-ascorbate oxidase-like protein [Medicago truncatula]
MGANFHEYVEFVVQNRENFVQSWHIDGGCGRQVGLEVKFDQTILVQDYPKSWTAIYMALDNVGMWNIRSENWERQYLGQQFYLKVYTPSKSLRDD